MKYYIASGLENAAQVRELKAVLDATKRLEQENAETLKRARQDNDF